MSEKKSNYEYLDKLVDGYGNMNEAELWGYLQKKHPKAHKMVEKLSETINYDPKGAMAVCLEILQDVNLENVAKDIEKIFNKEKGKV